MWGIDFQTINGMMLGIEFPTLIMMRDDDNEQEDEDAKPPFAIQIDLLILRIVLMRQ